MCAVLRIHFNFRVILFVLPPFFPNRCQQCINFFCNFPMRFRHTGLHRFLFLHRPGHVNDRRTVCFPNPGVQFPRRLEKLLLRSKRMRMLLQNNIIIIAEQNIKPHIRLCNMLCQEPAAMGDHRNFAFIACRPRFFCRHQRHIIIISMTVSNK